MKKFILTDSTKGIQLTFNLPQVNSENQGGSIDIISLNKETLISDLKNDIIACKKVDDMSVNTNFSVTMDENNAIIRIQGNLYGAFNMLTERDLVDENVVKAFREEYSDFDVYIELTKGVTISDAPSVLVPSNLLAQFIKSTISIIEILPPQEKNKLKPQFDAAFLVGAPAQTDVSGRHPSALFGHH